MEGPNALYFRPDFLILLTLGESLVEAKRLLAQLEQTTETKQIQSILQKLLNLLEGQLTEKEVLRYKQLARYQENAFSPAATEQSIKAAKDRVLHFLADRPFTKSELSKEVALLVVERLLLNFHLYLEELVERAPHGKATITQALQHIKIQNEYDVQHLLYSLIKPLFPQARTETVDDTGYGGIRYDIVMDDYNLTIETKCTHEKMTERQLTEEIAADSFHYKKGHVFFFVYDRYKIIRNKTAFEATYSRKENDKIVRTIVLQPIVL